MRRRFAATLALVLTVALTLVGCNGGGGGANSDPTLGRYEGYAITIFETNEPIEDTYDEGENYVELKEDGKAIVCLDGNPLESTYTLDGENITLVIDEDDGEYNSEGTLKDGVLTFDFLSLGLDLTFVKDGAEKPFEVTSTVPTATTDDTATTDEPEATETTEEIAEGTEESAEATDVEAPAEGETTEAAS